MTFQQALDSEGMGWMVDDTALAAPDVLEIEITDNLVHCIHDFTELYELDKITKDGWLLNLARAFNRNHPGIIEF